MLAVIGDLHMQHTAEDGIRYRDEAGVVHRMVDERNVHVRALRRFVHMLHQRARRCHARRVHLVLAGDVFEVHRSPRWFRTGHRLVRPYVWPERQRDDNPAWDALRRTVEAILADVVAENDRFFRDLRTLVEHGTYRFSEDAAERTSGEEPEWRFAGADDRPIPVQVHYVPGNHDRLVDYWPSTRRAVRRCLGMGEGQEPFPHRLDAELDHDDDRYHARVRHGHEYDKTNFPLRIAAGGGFTAQAPEYRTPSFGDYVTIDIATRLALAFRVHNACLLRQAAGDRCRELYRKLVEFDDVRPLEALGAYLLASKDAGGRDEARWLLPAIRDVFASARSNLLVGYEAARLGLGWVFGGGLISAIGSLLSLAPGWSVYPLIRAIARMVGGRGSQATAPRLAAREDGLGDAVRFMVAGHNHSPTVVPIRGENGRECFFLGPGTWRTFVERGVRAFGHVRPFGMVFVYSERESACIGREGRRFETWTGHMVPMVTTRTAEAGRLCAQPKARRIRFTRLEVVKVPRDGLRLRRSADLELALGADGAECEPFAAHVRQGESYELPARTADLDPELDGEVWCHAVEKDILFDDVLPWALQHLPRDEDGNFRRQPGALIIEDVRTRMVLHYQVEDGEGDADAAG
ncbi:MAG: hypothetical protein GXY85_05345 [Candidatus Brocadiaceae bacterium]|nr:hypothetical protein [Candidatus Brocadiaceae bacterium]